MSEIFEITKVNCSCFICDKNFQLIKYNNYGENKFIENETIINLFDFLKISSEDKEKLINKLKLGQPFISTSLLSSIGIVDCSIALIPNLDENNSIETVLGIVSKSDEGKIAINPSIIPFLVGKSRSYLSEIVNLLQPISHDLTIAENYKALGYLQNVNYSCYSMLKSIAELNDYFLLLTRAKQVDFKKLILNDFLDYLVKTLQVMLVDSGYKIELNICDEKIITAFDDDLISLALFHILANSCKFSPIGSTINITLSSNEDSAFITIVDESSGIKYNSMNQIFDPFFFIPEKPEVENENSLGLGPAIANLIIKLHKGTFFISNGVNNGTTITIKIPIVNDESQSLTLNSNSKKYVTDRFSNIYLIFSEICKFSFF